MNNLDEEELEGGSSSPVGTSSLRYQGEEPFHTYLGLFCIHDTTVQVPHKITQKYVADPRGERVPLGDTTVTLKYKDYYI